MSSLDPAEPKPSTKETNELRRLLEHTDELENRIRHLQRIVSEMRDDFRSVVPRPLGPQHRATSDSME